MSDVLGPPEIFLVSHTHWDREWYRTFQAFRARLVDTVDAVLDLTRQDPGYRFLLDGQAVILEDYLEIRPQRRDELERAVRGGRIAIGPWYVQPDSLIPSGESHVRNLLEGRRVARTFGRPSTVAYTPDSFGHPSQYPQILRGFGLRAFVYWRGNGSEIMELPAEYLWAAPDGTEILACHLWLGYFNAAALPADPAQAAGRLRAVVDDLAKRSSTCRVLLMNGSDHMLPDTNTAAVADALAEATGAKVVRGLLEDYVEGIDGELPRFSGELVGGRIAHLLPGVWSTRTWIKLRNRACEAALEGWAEPWAAIGERLGLPDERPALRAAWRALLHNQAHDSICGCSQDAVHEQMRARYDASEELADETATRVLERIAGLGPRRRPPWTNELDIAVFNPSPHQRTDVVRLPLDAVPPFEPAGDEFRIHPLVLSNLPPQHFVVDGVPARMVPAEGTRRVRLLPDQQAWDLEFLARDVPAFGYRRMRIAPCDPVSEESDDGREIVSDGVSVRAGDDGTLDVRFGDATFPGLCALEDVGDRGDSYDFDPVPGDWEPGTPEVRRFAHPSGLQRLRVRTTILVPGLDEGRRSRGEPSAPVRLVFEARVAPGVRRADLRVRFVNEAPDHRLRMLFPTGRPVDRFVAATTFDAAERTPGPRDAAGGVHPAPATFPSQGWVSANGLTVVAPGLVEAEVTPEGTIAVTLLRAVGWLSRHDLTTRPGPAGPALPTPGAQCIQATEARLALLPAASSAGETARLARDAELGLRAVLGAESALAPAGAPLLELEPREIVLSACKPAEDGEGIVLRVYNPSDDPIDAVARIGFRVRTARTVRLDETPSDEAVELNGETLRFSVSPRAMRSVLLD